jgi:hypothetical protein
LGSSGLDRFRAILPASEFRTAARQAGCSPRRKRTLTPEVVCWLMMFVALHSESMTQGLIRAWNWVRCRSPRKTATVTEEAFCQARGQLKLRFWRILWDRLVTRYERQWGSQMRWKGRFRVLAGDGSDVALPNVPALVRFFTRPKGGRGQSKRPQGRLVALCSVFTGFCVAFKFLSLRFSEHAALKHLVRYLRRDDLVLLDRGFFSLCRDVAYFPAGRVFSHPRHPANGRIRSTNPTPRLCGLARAVQNPGPCPPSLPGAASRTGLSTRSLPEIRVPTQLAGHFSAD